MTRSNEMDRRRFACTLLYILSCAFSPISAKYTITDEYQQPIYNIADISASSTLNENLNDSFRIIGGKPATWGQFPYQAFILMEAYPILLCGGAIVAEDYILTSASCGQKVLTYDDILVGAGNLRASQLEPSVLKKVIDVSIVVDKGSPAALLKLDSSFDLSGPNISLIGLQSAELATGTKCTISGWGSLMEGGSPSKILRYAEIPIIGKSECEASLGKVIIDGQLCAANLQGGVDACKYDEGGPLVCNGLLSGIVSAEYQCASTQKPTLYVGVAYHKSWIERHTVPSETEPTEPTVTEPVIIESSTKSGIGVVAVNMPCLFTMFFISIVIFAI